MYQLVSSKIMNPQKMLPKEELFEETGISFEDANIHRLNVLYIRKPEVDYIYHPFKIDLSQLPDVWLSDEHQNYLWASSSDIENMPLMDGAREALQHYLQAIQDGKFYSELRWQ